MSELLPTLAALAGACVFGVTGVMQQRATHRVTADPRDQGAFIRGLVGQPLWLVSTIGSVGGFALQGVALATGPIVLVQPLLVTGVLFAAVTSWLLRRHPVDRMLATGLVMTSAGLALFLVAARPMPGDDVLTIGDVVPLAAALGALIFGSLWLAARKHGAARSLALALAAGIAYGVTAAMAKVTLGQLDEGPVAFLTHWSLWAVIVLGPFGFLLNQHAFREAQLASPVVAVITVTDPLVCIGIGILWLGEAVHADSVAILGEVLGLLIMAAGVWLVAHRTPHLSGEAEAPAGRRVAARVSGDVWHARIHRITREVMRRGSL